MARQAKKTSDDLRQRILEHSQTLRFVLSAEELDEILRRAEQERLSHLELIEHLLSVPAQRRRERSTELRIKNAKFRDPTATLETFDWKFNGQYLDRGQMEELATGDFIRRRDNLVFVGQSGLGKSHLIQAIGRRCCLAGYRVRYILSAELLLELGKSLADGTMPKRLRYYAGFELLIIDEFGFDKLEREENPQATSLLYKVIDNRTRKRSTALVTNVDFETWGSYLGDPPMAMAMLDRVVDGAIIHKFQGKSYRAHRAQRSPTAKPSKDAPGKK
ncbi:MAG: IS21-like element helper ATPase IstB [Bryobacteraceae bacterium]